MLYKVSRTYVYLVLIVIAASAVTTVALQILAITGRTPWLVSASDKLLPAGFLSTGLALTLAEDNKVREIADSPWWLRAMAIASGIYSLAVILATALVRTAEFSACDEIVCISTISFAMNMVGLCIVHPVLWSGSVGRLEIIKRARNSVVVGVVIVGIFLIHNH